ncbi:VCBS repeat-containing protein [Flagellimonas sp.]|uniref:VCBS repeat-containing protein n=1 Tax=Flagellimonas sp. TaxID=2058762 RepID=UPI003B527489
MIYEYFYNGGGVAAGDFNGDDLIDLYFTSSMSTNKFYLNRGYMQFEEVSKIAGLKPRKGTWKTGVTHVDINGDGRLDLYQCYSGALPPSQRKNQLFINTGNDKNGIPTFEEKAADYGLDSPAFSNQGYFFDFDKDGDLDMLLLNHNPQSLPEQSKTAAEKMLRIPDSLMGVRLYKQTNEKFIDVTEQAGISGTALTFGLGIGMGDVNNDGWTDFYVCNDYDVPDYLYINNQDGTFSDRIKISMGHTSQFSMGNDIADVNNDGLADIITLDMLPESNERQKLLMMHDSYTKYDVMVQKGFHHQNMRNMLQLNNGDGTFSEIGQLAAIDKTDWSWSPLLADFDNDGWKDLHITNGYFRDFTNMDFINYMDDFTKGKDMLKREEVLKLVKQAPKSDFVNYVFKNNANLTFSNVTLDWGMNEVSNSNGAAYADLDNDGDLDMIVNNINKPAFIYENQADELGGNYLSIRLKGEQKNTNGIGAKVQLFYDGQMQEVSQFPSRGYLSAVSEVLHFGLGNITVVDSLKVIWESSKQEIQLNVKANQTLILNEQSAEKTFSEQLNAKPIFTQTRSLIAYKDPEINILDFDRQALLTSELSHDSPSMVKGDLNADGLQDIFVGGSTGYPAKIYLANASGGFAEHTGFKNLAIADAKSHDTDAVIFDANKDGYNDIYVASGGYHLLDKADEALQDRLYLGNSEGNFAKISNALPVSFSSSQTLAIEDFNQDGHPDVFIGGGFVPGRYPENAKPQLMVNDGEGHFFDKIKEIAPQLEQFGAIKDALWLDLNQDGTKELIVIGEWSPVSIFAYVNGKFENQTKEYLQKEYNGWWNTIESADINEDGIPDFIVGNVGLNTQYVASENEPIELFYADFDGNGSIDPFLNYYKQGKSYPEVSREELKKQLSHLGSKYTNYESYANETMESIFSSEELENADKLMVNHLKTALFLSDSKGSYIIRELPIQAQYAPVNAIQFLDYDNDGHQDVLLCGNNSHFKISIGRSDANYGVLLKGNGKGDFDYVKQSVSGLKLKGDIKKILKLDDSLIFGINQQPIITYKLNSF